MSDMLEMHAYLMCASRLQTTFCQGNIIKSLQDLIMCNGCLSLRAVWKHCHRYPVFKAASDITFYRTFIIFKIAPYESLITTRDAMFKKLFR